MANMNDMERKVRPLMKKPVCVGVVGAGIISDIYLKNMTGKFSNLRVKSVRRFCVCVRVADALCFNGHTVNIYYIFIVI